MQKALRHLHSQEPKKKTMFLEYIQKVQLCDMSLERLEESRPLRSLMQQRKQEMMIVCIKVVAEYGVEGE